MSHSLSPMFKHAIESFEHGLEHFLDNTDRSRKFALLHIDQSIELLLKEKCMREGKSIYKSDGKTLSIHEAFQSIAKVASIPERPRLEELHDLRNTIQHKGLLPDQATTQYYVDIAYRFTKRFLKEELGSSIEIILSQQHRALMEGPDPIEAPVELVSALEQASHLGSPSSKIVAGYVVLEKAAKIMDSIVSDKTTLRGVLKKSSVARGIPENKVNKRLRFVFMLRSKVLRSDYEPTEKEVNGFFKVVATLLTYAGFEGFENHFRKKPSKK